VVYKGTYKGQQVAVKRLMGEFSNDKLQEFEREADLMKQLPPHSNVLQFVGICIVPLCIVTQYYERGNLKEYLRKSPLMELQEMLRIMRGICQGIMHLHKNNIVHRDLAARNILLSAAMQPVVCDFGFARELEQQEEIGQTKSEVGPIRWMAVECLTDRLYSKKSDVWSFGVIGYEMVTRGAEPFGRFKQPVTAAAAVINGSTLEPDIPSTCDEKLKQILVSCWIRNPDERPDFI